VLRVARAARRCQVRHVVSGVIGQGSEPESAGAGWAWRILNHTSIGSGISLQETVWCKYSNESYDIVIRQYYG